MKSNKKYVAPQMTVAGFSASDIVTVSFDLFDNWKSDPFGAEE